MMNCLALRIVHASKLKQIVQVEHWHPFAIDSTCDNEIVWEHDAVRMASNLGRNDSFLSCSPQEKNSCIDEGCPLR